MSNPSFVYVIYIVSTPNKIWQALTDAKMSERYWQGNRVESDWKVGSPFALKRDGPKPTVTGTVLEFKPPRRLSYSFQPAGLDNEKPSRVSFELERQKDQVKLSLSHDEFEPGSTVFESISRGWPLALSGLKSFLETGKVLHAFWYQEKLKRGAKEARE